MTEGSMPTTLPNPVDRRESDFIAVDTTCTKCIWIDSEMIWRCVKEKPRRECAEGHNVTP